MVTPRTKPSLVPRPSKQANQASQAPVKVRLPTALYIHPSIRPSLTETAAPPPHPPPPPPPLPPIIMHASLSFLLSFAFTLLPLVSAHTQIWYPPWRDNSFLAPHSQNIYPCTYQSRPFSTVPPTCYPYDFANEVLSQPCRRRDHRQLHHCPHLVAARWRLSQRHAPRRCGLHLHQHRPRRERDQFQLHAVLCPAQRDRRWQPLLPQADPAPWPAHCGGNAGIYPVRNRRPQWRGIV